LHSANKQEAVVITTWKFRIKNTSNAKRKLSSMARAVNFVWNFAKRTQISALQAKSGRIILDKKTGKEIGIPNFLTKFEFNNLVAGSSKELGLHSQTVQGVVEEYATRRAQFKKLLRWRGRKALGWIPFKASGIKLNGDSVTYAGKKFRFWKSREFPLDSKIKTGSFTQDSKGNWFLNVTFESAEIGLHLTGVTEKVGVDIGIKTLAALSNGQKIERPNLRNKFLEKLKKLEKTRKFARRKHAKQKKYFKLPKLKQERNLHIKIANKRKDYLHKESTKLVQSAKLIVVGDVPCKLMNRSKNLSGISLDSGIGMFKAMVHFKAKRAGATYFEVSERNSTQTCSKCQCKNSLRIGLGVREWVCENCGSSHDRDINAARNILRAGISTLTECA
jgi:putative transposase